MGANNPDIATDADLAAFEAGLEVETTPDEPATETAGSVPAAPAESQPGAEVATGAPPAAGQPPAQQPAATSPGGTPETVLVRGKQYTIDQIKAGALDQLVETHANQISHLQKLHEQDLAELQALRDREAPRAPEQPRAPTPEEMHAERMRLRAMVMPEVEAAKAGTLWGPEWADVAESVHPVVMADLILARRELDELHAAVVAQQEFQANLIGASERSQQAAVRAGFQRAFVGEIAAMAKEPGFEALQDVAEGQRFIQHIIQHHDVDPRVVTPEWMRNVYYAWKRPALEAAQRELAARVPASSRQNAAGEAAGRRGGGLPTALTELQKLDAELDLAES